MHLSNSNRNPFYLLKTLLVSVLLIICQIESIAQTLPFNPGTLSSGNEVICNGGNPSLIAFSTPAASGSTYQWYFQNGLITAVSSTAGTTGWTLISGATSNTYDPPSGLTASRTFACRVTKSGISLWASVVRRITVLPSVNFGGIAAGNQTFSLSGNPNPIVLSTAVSGGSGTFSYQWYSSPGVVSAPTGTSIPTSWTAIAGATTNTYDPPVQYQSITYALRVDPTGSPDCSNARWAASERKITVNISSGTLAAGNQTICFGGDPNNISFSTAATGGVTYQWYSRDGIITAPTTSASTSGWSAISGATANSYNPPAGLAVSRTYACRVINGPVGLWANGVRQITVTTFDAGTVVGTEELFAFTGNPSPIQHQNASLTTYTLQWYSFTGLTSAPTGSAIPSGWTLIAGATASSYDPPSIATSRTYACLINSGGCSRWASGAARVVISSFDIGSVSGSIDTICYGDISSLTFSTPPSAGTSVSWYKVNSSPNKPTDPIEPASDIFIANGVNVELGRLFVGDLGLTESQVFQPRTYQARVTNGSVSYWMRPTTVKTRNPLNPGDVDVWLPPSICNGDALPQSFSITPPSMDYFSFYGAIPHYLFNCRWFYTTDTTTFTTGSGQCFANWDTLTGLNWKPAGPSFIYNASPGSPAISAPVLPIITEFPYSSATGSYAELKFKLLVNPVKTASGLESIMCDDLLPEEECIGEDMNKGVTAYGFYRVRINQCGSSARMFMPEENPGTHNKMQDVYLGNAFPNPAQEYANIELQLPDNTSKAEIVLLNVSGQEINIQPVSTNNSRQKVQLNLAELPAGLYFYFLEVDGINYGTKRISIVR
jgi:hypothetical protein